MLAKIVDRARTPSQGWPCFSARGRTDRPDTGHAHQPIARRILTGHRANLVGQGFDARIEPMPIVEQSLDDVQHAWRQDVCAFGKYAGQFDAQEA
jgi:hypothetical protein